MNKKGFTLVELIAVIIIMAAIALFAFPSIINLIENNQIKKNEEDLKTLYLATENYILQNYKDEYNSVPFDIYIEELVENNYITINDDIDAFGEDDMVKVDKDENGVWIYSLKPNLFDISKVVSSTDVVNNNDGTIEVLVTTSYAGQPFYLKNYAPGLEVGKTYRLEAETTSSKKFIWLSGAEKGWAFEDGYIYDNELTVTQNHLDSIVVWYTDSEHTAVISDIRIYEVNY